MSSTRQWSVQDWWVSRNPSVDANGTTLNPAERSNRETDFRTDGSSSMTPITGVADCFVSTIPVPCESPCSPARRAGETHAHYRDRNGAHEARSEEHTSELQSHVNLVCRLLLEKKKNKSAICMRIPS